MYKKNKNIVLRKIDPSYFLIDITKCYNNTEQNMFITDEIGAEIWNSISDGDSFEMVFLKFLDKLTDDKTDEFVECVKADTREYIQKLINQECIYEV